MTWLIISLRRGRADGASPTRASGADVRRARGEIAKPRIVSEIEFALERAVDLVDELEGVLQLQS
jgi:hypothetical protein